MPRKRFSGKKRVPKGPGMTALTHAVLWGREKCVDFLIQAGADVNIQDQSGWTTLMYAAWMGKDRCFESLINGGADANIKDRKGSTALMKAAEGAHHKCVDIMIQGKNSTDVLCLSHLCRAAIRTHLLPKNNSNLYVAVSKLGLPEPLKKFLLLCEILDEDDVAFLSSMLL